MKIIAWNLKNIGHNKLAKQTNAVVGASGYGASVLDFIVNVVTGNIVWNGTNSGVAADLFLVIELKSGGKSKGTAINGTGVICMANLLAAMNTVVANTPGMGTNYQYVQVPGLVLGVQGQPLLTGRHESVGIIYNSRALTYVGQSVLKNNATNYLLPRTPYLAQFTIGATATPLNVVGIHAPPPGGAAAAKFKNPITYCNQLPSCPDLMHGNPQNYLMGGDFNCAPNSTWVSNGVTLTPFNNPTVPGKTLAGYGTSLPAGTLTSVRRKVDSTQIGQLQYLNGAYDNILYKFNPAVNFGAYALDLIGNLYAGTLGLVAKLNNFWRVSDHIPVAMESAPAAQTIAFQPLPGNVQLSVTTSLTLIATASSGLAIAFAVAGPAAIVGNALLLTGKGAVTVMASQAGNTSFSAATPIAQTIQVQ